MNWLVMIIRVHFWINSMVDSIFWRINFTDGTRVIDLWWFSFWDDSWFSRSLLVRNVMKEKKNYQMLCIVIKIVLKQYKCMNRFYSGIISGIKYLVKYCG